MTLKMKKMMNEIMAYFTKIIIKILRQLKIIIKKKDEKNDGKDKDKKIRNKYN